MFIKDTEELLFDLKAQSRKGRGRFSSRDYSESGLAISIEVLDESSYDLLSSYSNITEDYGQHKPQGVLI